MSKIRPNISFEFFPPKTLAASFQVWESLHMLAPLSPNFISITYGADGGTRDRTQEMVEIIHQNFKFNIAPHLTCANMSKEETIRIAQRCWDIGVRQIVALRGDPPKRNSKFIPHKEGFKSSIDLINGLSQNGFKNIRVGAYPELHPDASSMEANIDWLKAKFDAGATSAITQFFFEPKTFLRFRDKCVKAGIKAPIIPGVLPIENWEKNKVFIARCGAYIPSKIERRFINAKRDKLVDEVSTEIATDLCTSLIYEGIENIHFYTLNRPTLTHQICLNLGITENTVHEAVA
jgi:methylenetetrahydrofolate reductase (NADPH)